MVSLSKHLGKKSRHCDTTWDSAEQIGILWKDDTWLPEKIVILCRDAPEGRQDTWISFPEPEEVVHARNVIAFFVWAWPSGFCD